MPQNSVNAILQTRDGYLWLTTLGGLVRYDGVRFKVFDKANSKGIRSNRLTALLEDRAGTLWVGTEDSGLIRYQDGVFTTYTASYGHRHNWIQAIQEGTEGDLWILTDGGISRWKDGEFILHSTQSSDLRNPGVKANSATTSHDGIAFYDAAGLYRLVNGQMLTYTTADGLSSLRINSLYQDQYGTLWEGTESAGLNRLQDGKFAVLTERNGLPSNHIEIKAVCEDRKGGLWIADGDGGLGRLKDGVWTAYTSDDGLSSDSIITIYEDREGNIWIGTSNNGLARWREESVKVYSKQDGLTANNIYPIYEDREGSIWIGAWPGLNRFKNGVFTHYAKQDGLSSETITSLYEARDGSLWIGTYGGGVNRLKDGRFTAYTDRDGLKANGILAILEDGEGSLWFGTTNALYRYRDGAFTHFTTEQGLSQATVNVLYEDRQGTLWIGTRGGLTKLAGGTFSAYTERDGLSGSYVRSIYEDREGILWIGTYDGGLNRLKDGRFTNYTVQDGLFDNGVFHILEDNRDNFWMSSNRGIYRVSRQELNDFAEGKVRSITSIAYGKKDGMLNTECNGGLQPAGWKSRDGRLWFPTQEGVAVIDPEAVQVNNVPPPVLIEDFLIDSEPVAFHDGVQVQPGKQRLEITFTGLSFIKSESMQFKYKLAGLDEDWVDAGTRRVAYYTYVPPGRYTFRVIAANSDGLWNTEGASVEIIVHPPFWRTWWFYSLTLAGLVGVAILAHKRHILKLKRAHAAQEAFSRQLIASQEKDRQRIASELHDGLGQSLVIIKNRALLGLGAIAIDHERAQEQLGEISAATSQAIAEMKEIAYDLRPYQLDRLGLTKAIEAMLKRAANSSSALFSVELDQIDNLYPKDCEIHLYRIMQECINNVVKHAEATEVRIAIKREAARVNITIRDNGSGFNYEANSAAESRDQGFGLIGIAERVQILGGEHEIHSAPGLGTTIIIKLNLQDGWDER